MRGFLFLGVLMTLIPGVLLGITPDDTVQTRHLDSVIVTAYNAGYTTPVTFTQLNKKDLQKSNPSNSLPMILSAQPSVVAVNEGGTGLGYSKLTIRGSKGSQINVTLNGITLNDAESQEVFWVNIPSLNNIVNSVQVQRGLGTSANGTGAFGASINMSTISTHNSPYVNFSASAGSYNTFLASVAAGTGKSKSGLYFDVNYSKNYTDGYIRNAYANVQSLFVNTGWIGNNNSLRLTYLMGDQHTGITWNGISLSQYEKDRRYNPAGEYYDSLGNVYYYDNETDNYRQHHIQLNYTHQFNESLVWNTTFNYSRGDGYYENYKTDKSSTKFGFTDKWYGDFIVREAMANNYFVLNSDVRYKTKKLSLTGSINLSQYDGDHFGKVLWSNVIGTENNFDYNNHYWYLNNGLKKEFNAIVRGEYKPNDLINLYLDLQYRGVSLDMNGDEDDKGCLDYSTKWNFFNPRAGITFTLPHRQKIYMSAALGHREPGRSDIKEVIISNNSGDTKPSLKPEKMVDVELGYMVEMEKATISANIYFMEYWDMLLETGKLSDVGYAIKENVGRSYRRGIELAVNWNPVKWLVVDANTTLSLNKVKDFYGYFDKIDSDWNYLGGQEKIYFGKTTMLMSPNVTGMMHLTFIPFKETFIKLSGKYVGKQYIDNTMSDDRHIPHYFISDLSITKNFKIKESNLEISGYINNLFNKMYYADGWTYNVYNNDTQTIVSDLGIYPQSPINFSIKLSYTF